MDATLTVTVLGRIPVAPPPEAISLPLSFLDLYWFNIGPVSRLIFYQHPISRTHFLDSLIPMLKNSLSLTLQHYTPLAGKIIFSPDNSKLPEIRYVDGDTVPLVFAESNSSKGHFGHLTSDHPRSCSGFHPLVPILPQTSRAEDGSVGISVLALQVTLFPDVGICIGVTNHHGIGDASSIFRFMKAWEFFSNEKTSSVSLPSEFQPFYNRAVMRDPKGLETLFWDNMKNIKFDDTDVQRPPPITDRVRATFALTRDDIQRLKNHILARRPELTHVSSFTVICSFVWTCLAKSRYAEADQDNIDDKDEIFCCAADCRARLDPPVPGNYLGNCLVACAGYAKTKQLMGEEGLAEAAVVIGESIRRRLYDKELGIFGGAENWFKLFSLVKPDRALSVAGSPNFDYYELDFGWGRPKKFEIPSTDLTGAISLSKSKNHEGGLEFGLALPEKQLHNFTSIFTQDVKAL